MPANDFDKFAFKMYKILGAGWVVVVAIGLYFLLKKDDTSLSK